MYVTEEMLREAIVMVATEEMPDYDRIMLAILVDIWYDAQDMKEMLDDLNS